MAYIRVHTIKGHKYLYKHESYRVPGVKNPRKRTTYLGPLMTALAGLQAASGIGVNKANYFDVQQLMKDRTAAFKANVAFEADMAARTAAAWETANAREGQNSAPREESANSIASPEASQTDLPLPRTAPYCRKNVGDFSGLDVVRCAPLRIETHANPSHWSAKSVPQLSDPLIRAAKPPEAGTFSLWDSSLKGFGVRISKGGAKTFVVLIGSGRRQAVGRYPLMSLSEARTEAKRILAEKTLGRVRPKHVAFDDAQADFLNECANRLRPLTLKLYRRHLTVHFPFGRRNIGEIDPREIVRKLNGLNHRPSEKEHAHRVGQTFFRWCVRQHIIERSPMENMQAPSVGRSRDRVLADDELAAVFRTASTGETSFHRFVALLLLLGLRRGEAANLRWDFFDERSRTLTIPASITKNKRALRIPYGPAVSTILKEIPKFSAVYLFPAAREQINGKPVTVMTGFSKPKRLFDSEAGVYDWVLHDCRRVFATGLQKLGVRLEVIESLLNHVSGSRAGIVGVYQRYDYFPEMQDAIHRWEQHLQELLLIDRSDDWTTQATQVRQDHIAARRARA